MGEVIRVSGLTKRFGQKIAVQDLHLSVRAGSIFGLLGSNGAGKSTTIDCMLGTERADAGEIRILGTDPRANRRSLFQHVGVQFQESAFQSGLKVREICEITHSLYENPIDWQKTVAEFELSDKLKTTISDLSGGERQKLCILLAMMGRPKVIFLDELTTGLDPVARRDIWQTLLRLKQTGVTLFLTSHYMDEVEKLCDEILVIKGGKELIRGTAADVVHRTDSENMDEAFVKLVEEGIR
ncbi:ABC transporter ATP-binding protein [Geomicrobium sp. JCM 19039]|uniref:ABC transporter ATP-binding protein n=1 Tax=Geomicrobium sp. JCM 19039 TaxID=1460636 RepID=UPI00045F4932|nr:ABC transporter ATP-binding protein [Geomicrobium sp. JCM 19039]GAK12104.1 ABC transporter, ATP-binding protein [Geomicrobium sp. JCM 19039]